MSGVCCLLLILLTVQQVVARYFFSSGSIAMQELQWHLFGAVFLLAMGTAMRHDAHVRVDLFYHRMGKKKRALVDFFGILFFVLPLSYVLMIYGWEDVSRARSYPSSIAIDHYTQRFFPQGSAWAGASAALEAWMRQSILVGEVSPNASGLEARWIPRAFIPLGAFFLMLQGIGLMLEKGTVLLRPRD